MAAFSGRVAHPSRRFRQSGSYDARWPPPVDSPRERNPDSAHRFHRSRGPADDRGDVASALEPQPGLLGRGSPGRVRAAHRGHRHPRSGSEEVRLLPVLMQNRPSTLWSRWLDLAEADAEAQAVVHWTAGEEPFRWRRADLLAAATRYAARLAGRGIGQGDVCALIIRHHRDFYPLYLGISAIGALPAVLAYPNPRLHPAKVRDGLVGMSRRSGLDWLLVERELEPVVRPLTDSAESTIRDLLFPLEWSCGAGGGAAMEPFPLGDADPDLHCLLQHSSGTTGLQKPVMLSHRAVLEHVSAYGEAIALTASDRVVSWLPLYHDMGLIAAFHLSLASGIPIVQLDPFEWVVAPILLLEAIAGEGGTLTWLPNFAYNLIADRSSDEEMETIRLDSMRMFINCSEPVREESHARFLARFARYGVRPEMLAACYAMAETTFASTQPAPGQAARAVPQARDAL